MLAPSPDIDSLHTWFKCSICRSQGTFFPGLPCTLTVLLHCNCLEKEVVLCEHFESFDGIILSISCSENQHKEFPAPEYPFTITLSYRISELH